MYTYKTRLGFIARQLSMNIIFSPSVNLLVSFVCDKAMNLAKNSNFQEISKGGSLKLAGVT